MANLSQARPNIIPQIFFDRLFIIERIETQNIGKAGLGGLASRGAPVLLTEAVEGSKIGGGGDNNTYITCQFLNLFFFQFLQNSGAKGQLDPPCPFTSVATVSKLP